MRPRPAAAALLLVLFLPLAAGAAERALAGTYALEQAGAVRLDLPVGKVHVQSGPTPQVQVDLEVNCDRDDSSCPDRAKDVRLESERSSDRLVVRVAGFPKSNDRGLHVDGTITVPADRPLQVDMGVGELEIAGVGSDLKVNLGVGEVKLQLPEASVQRIRLAAGVGQTTLRAAHHHFEGDRSYLIGSRLVWTEGAGHAQIAVDVGVGEVEARLE